jgi:beta-glucanase (GH16 family)
MKRLNFILSSSFILIGFKIFSQSTAPNTTNVDDDNYLSCYQPGDHSIYGEHCHCAWEKVNNINLQNYPCNYSTLIKVLDDEFDSNTLDFDTWKIGYPWGPEHIEGDPAGYGGMPYGNNITVNNGYLYMQPKMQTLTQGQFGSYYAGPNPIRDYSYTEAAMTSMMRWGYGKFEIRCKMADNPVNLNSAFWLFGECHNEIDVFETFDDTNEGGIYDNNPHRDHVNMRIQTTAYSAQGHCNKERCYRKYFTKLPVSEYLNQWHTYTLYWDEYSIQLEIDGVNTGELITSLFKIFPQPSAKLCTDLESNKDYRKMISYPYATDSRMSLILDVAVRALKHTNASYPASLGNDRIMTVDYIKVWQQERCGQVRYVCGQFDDKYDESIVFGSQVNMSPNNCGWTLLGNSGSASYYQAIAEDEVVLLPNFNAQNGSNFSAFIKPCEYSSKMKAPTIDTLIESEGLTAMNDLSVLPNPNKGIFKVFLPKKIKGKFEIFNGIGQSVFEQNIDENLQEISVSLEQLTKGFYYLKIHSVEKDYTTKIIINE